MSEQQDTVGTSPIEPIMRSSDQSDALAWSLLSDPNSPVAQLARLASMPAWQRRELVVMEEKRQEQIRLVMSAFGMPPYLIEAMNADELQLSAAAAQSKITIERIAHAITPIIERIGRWSTVLMAGIDYGKLIESTADRRARKAAQRERRKAFMQRGKHGLKRPRGKRKVGKKWVS